MKTLLVLAMLVPLAARAADPEALDQLRGQGAAAPAAPADPDSTDQTITKYAAADGTQVLKDNDREPKEGDEVLAELRGGEQVRVIKQIPGWSYAEVNRRDFDEKEGWKYVRGWIKLGGLTEGFATAAASIPQQHAFPASPQNPSDPKDLLAPGADAGDCREAFIKSLLTFVPPKANPPVPYVWGGTSHRGADCSGLVVAAMLESNCINAAPPRRAQDQQRAARPVSLQDMKPGDLVFTGNPAHHVFTYVGNDANGNRQVIEAPQTGMNVYLHPWSPRPGQTFGQLLP
ncbi:MAG TPA: NlpC/P60 family protein [Elusimicrobiota bacterium]|nr:NlpC/P60 family protein [Elusimicrobiota bacterium]